MGVPTALAFGVKSPQSVARVAVHPWPGSSPAQRFQHIAQHRELTPCIAIEAEFFAEMEVEARCTQDSLKEASARRLQTEVAGRLFRRQQKRVHAAGQAAVDGAEVSIRKALKMQARKARKAMKQVADEDPQPLRKFGLSKALKRADGRK